MGGAMGLGRPNPRNFDAEEALEQLALSLKDAFGRRAFICR